MNGAALALVLGLALMVVLRVPLAFALGIATALALWLTEIDLVTLAQRFIAGTQSFSLLAIPFFILAGDLMTAGGISRRLVGVADVLVRHRTGGIGMVTVLAAAFFAAISGSAPATTAAIGTIMIPEMVARGYSKPFATALAVAGGIIGPLIPPSIPLIIWGVLAEQSISRLFLAGVVPGILLSLGLMVLCWRHAKSNAIAPQTKASRAEVLSAIYEGKWALLGPIFVLGGIYGGIVTPTEAAVVAVVFSLLVGHFAYHELNFTSITRVSNTSLRTMTIVMFIIAAANGFGWMIAFEQLPGQLTDALAGASDQPFIFLLLLNAVLLFIGCLMDNLAAMIILSGFLIPIGNDLGMDPIQFGAMVTTNLTIGMATPPFGYALFVGAAISGLKISAISRPLLPMLGIMILVLLAICYIPSVSLWLPNWLSADKLNAVQLGMTYFLSASATSSPTTIPVAAPKELDGRGKWEETWPARPAWLPPRAWECSCLRGTSWPKSRCGQCCLNRWRCT